MQEAQEVPGASPVPHKAIQTSTLWDGGVFNGAACRLSKAPETQLPGVIPTAVGGFVGFVYFVFLCCSCPVDAPQLPSDVYIRFYWIQKEVGPRSKEDTRPMGRKHGRVWELL